MAKGGGGHYLIWPAMRKNSSERERFIKLEVGHRKEESEKVHSKNLRKKNVHHSSRHGPTDLGILVREGGLCPLGGTSKRVLERGNMGGGKTFPDLDPVQERI